MELNQKNWRKLLGLGMVLILFYWGLENHSLLGKTCSVLLGLIFPFILGGCMAFIVNVPMRGIEKLLFSAQTGKKRKMARGISLLLTFLLVIGVIFVVSFLILPELGRSLGTLAETVPQFVSRTAAWAAEMATKHPQISQWLSTLEINWSNILGQTAALIQSWLSAFLGSTLNIAAGVFSGVVTFFLAFVFSIYLLLDKEKLGGQVKMVLHAWVPRWADKILGVSGLAAKTFSSFLSGQCAEAIILGLLFFVAMTILRFPYALMISVLIAFTALIPLFGAFIGCFVGAFLILMVSPMKAFWFILLFLLIQQLEGNLIYPRVVGSSVGLPAMWVLVAVTLGGNTLGIAGMLLSIPLCSVLYTLFRQATKQRLKQLEEKTGEKGENAGG